MPDMGFQLLKRIFKWVTHADSREPVQSQAVVIHAECGSASSY